MVYALAFSFAVHSVFAVISSILCSVLTCVMICIYRCMVHILQLLHIALTMTGLSL